MYVQEPVQASIWNCLNHYAYEDATFLAERLVAEVPSEETIHLLATCYYRSGQIHQAYDIIKCYEPSTGPLKFLFVRCCLDLKKFTEIESIFERANRHGRPKRGSSQDHAMGGGNVHQNRVISIDDMIREVGDEATSFAFQILSHVYSSTERQLKACLADKRALHVNPLLWSSFESLCKRSTRHNNSNKSNNEFFVDPQSIFKMDVSNRSAKTATNDKANNKNGGASSNAATVGAQSSSSRVMRRCTGSNAILDTANRMNIAAYSSSNTTSKQALHGMPSSKKLQHGCTPLKFGPMSGSGVGGHHLISNQHHHLNRQSMRIHSTPADSGSMKSSQLHINPQHLNVTPSSNNLVPVLNFTPVTSSAAPNETPLDQRENSSSTIASSKKLLSINDSIQSSQHNTSNHHKSQSQSIFMDDSVFIDDSDLEENVSKISGIATLGNFSFSKGGHGHGSASFCSNNIEGSYVPPSSHDSYHDTFDESNVSVRGNAAPPPIMKPMAPRRKPVSRLWHLKCGEGGGRNSPSFNDSWFAPNSQGGSQEDHQYHPKFGFLPKQSISRLPLMKNSLLAPDMTDSTGLSVVSAPRKGPILRLMLDLSSPGLAVISSTSVFQMTSNAGVCSNFMVSSADNSVQMLSNVNDGKMDCVGGGADPISSMSGAAGPLCPPATPPVVLAASSPHHPVMTTIHMERNHIHSTEKQQHEHKQSPHALKTPLRKNVSNEIGVVGGVNNNGGGNNNFTPIMMSGVGGGGACCGGGALSPFGNNNTSSLGGGSNLRRSSRLFGSTHGNSANFKENNNSNVGGALMTPTPGGINDIRGGGSVGGQASLLLINAGGGGGSLSSTPTVQGGGGTTTGVLVGKKDGAPNKKTRASSTTAQGSLNTTPNVNRGYVVNKASSQSVMKTATNKQNIVLVTPNNNNNNFTSKISTNSVLVNGPPEYDLDVVVGHEQILHQTTLMQCELLKGLLSLLKQLGDAYLALTKFDLKRSLELFDFVPSVHRKTGWVLSHIAKAKFELAQYKECVKTFDQMMSVDPFCLHNTSYYSTALWHLNKPVALSALAHKLIVVNRFSADAWISSANCLSLVKEHDSAIRALRRAVQVQPTCAYAYTLLGHELVCIEELEKALTCFQTAVRLDSCHYNAWYGIGLIYYKQERFSLALIYYQKALTVNPTNAVLMCHVAVVQHALKQSKAALLTLDNAIKIAPSNPLCKFERASILFACEEYTLALKQLESLKSMAPKESPIFFLLGKVHTKLNNPHLALMNYSWAMDLDPKGAAANSQIIKEALDSPRPPPPATSSSATVAAASATDGGQSAQASNTVAAVDDARMTDYEDQSMVGGGSTGNGDANDGHNVTSGEREEEIAASEVVTPSAAVTTSRQSNRQHGLVGGGRQISFSAIDHDELQTPTVVDREDTDDMAGDDISPLPPTESPIISNTPQNDGSPPRWFPPSTTTSPSSRQSSRRSSRRINGSSDSSIRQSRTISTNNNAVLSSDDSL